MQNENSQENKKNKIENLSVINKQFLCNDTTSLKIDNTETTDIILNSNHEGVKFANALIQNSSHKSLSKHKLESLHKSGLISVLNMDRKALNNDLSDQCEPQYSKISDSSNGLLSNDIEYCHNQLLGRNKAFDIRPSDIDSASISNVSQIHSHLKIIENQLLSMNKILSNFNQSPPPYVNNNYSVIQIPKPLNDKKYDINNEDNQVRQNLTCKDDFDFYEHYIIAIFMQVYTFIIYILNCFQVLRYQVYMLSVGVYIFMIVSMIFLFCYIFIVEKSGLKSKKLIYEVASILPSIIISTFILFVAKPMIKNTV